MLKKLFFSIFASALLLTSGSIYAVPATMSNIDQQMDAALQKADAEAQAKLKEATRQDVVPVWATKVELENAIIQLEVKKTLVNNFRGTATLEQSPAVQAKLLQLLNKDMITESDLAELQNLTNQEKARIKAATPAFTPITPTPVAVPVPAN